MEGHGRLEFSRSAGVLLPVSSLPSPYGIGSFGEAARRWVDFLHEAGQSYWQILPLNPTGYGDSPYQSFSAFAGNPYFIDLDTLCDEGLLDLADYAGCRWGRSPKSVDYGAIYRLREPILRKAFSRFTDRTALDDFISRNHWFEHYGLYMAIKATQGGSTWLEWDEPLRMRHPDTLNRISASYADDILYHAFVQYQFDRQWHALRDYANAKGIRIIGDIPIYVSLDSADIWANRELFQLDDRDRPSEVAGCPPDSFSADGQLWGNPLYDWEVMAKTGYRWWIERLTSSFGLYDVVRFDHFRGLESYFAIPYGAATAVGGQWKTGPGAAFIDAIRLAFPGARFIAEDLGYLTDEVRELRSYSGWPGMKILQYAFDSREAGDYSPHAYSADAVVYPGTHDNDTVSGWAVNAPRHCVRDAMEYMGLRRRSHLPHGMVRLAFQSGAGLAVIPMQDWLALGSRARTNIPSTVGGNNWRWRIKQGALRRRLAETMVRMTRMYGRQP